MLSTLPSRYAKPRSAAASVRLVKSRIEARRDMVRVLRRLDETFYTARIPRRGKRKL